MRFDRAVEQCVVCGETDTWLLRRNPRLCFKCNPNQTEDKLWFSDHYTIQNQELIAKYWRAPDTSFLEET